MVTQSPVRISLQQAISIIKTSTLEELEEGLKDLLPEEMEILMIAIGLRLMEED